MDRKKLISYFSISAFGALGLAALVAGIMTVVAAGAAGYLGLGGAFIFIGVMNIITGLFLWGFAAVIYFFYLVKEHPYALFFGGGGLGVYLLVFGVIFSVYGAAAVPALAGLLLCDAFAVYGYLLYRKWQEEGLLKPRQKVVIQAASPAEALKQLANLKDAGVITEEEYQSKRNEILDRVGR